MLERLKCEAPGVWCQNEAREIRVPNPDRMSYRIRELCDEHRHLAYTPPDRAPATRNG